MRAAARVVVDDDRGSSPSPLPEYPTYAASVSSDASHHVRSPSEHNNNPTPLSSFGQGTTTTDTGGQQTFTSSSSTTTGLFRRPSTDVPSTSPSLTGTPRTPRRTSLLARALLSPLKRSSEPAPILVPLPPPPKPILLNRSMSEPAHVAASDMAGLETNGGFHPSWRPQDDGLPSPHAQWEPTTPDSAVSSPAALHITRRGPISGASYVGVQIPSPSFTSPMFTPSTSPAPGGRRGRSTPERSRSPWQYLSAAYPDGFQPPAPPGSLAGTMSPIARARRRPLPPVPPIPREHKAQMDMPRLPAPLPVHPATPTPPMANAWYDLMSPISPADSRQPLAGPSRLRTDSSDDHPLFNGGLLDPSSAASPNSIGVGLVSHQPSIASFATSAQQSRLGHQDSSSSLVPNGAMNSEKYGMGETSQAAETDAIDAAEKGGSPWWARPRRVGPFSPRVGKRPSPLAEEPAVLGEGEMGPDEQALSPTQDLGEGDEVSFLPRTTYQLQRNGSRFTEHTSDPPSTKETPPHVAAGELPLRDASDSTANDPWPTVRKRRFWPTFLALAVSNWVVALELTSIPVAMPTIAAAFNMTVTEFCWVGSVYSLGAAAVVPWSGPLAYVMGRPSSLLLALLLFGGGSAAASAAHSVAVLLVGRALQGCGSGFLGCLSLLVLGDMVRPEEQGAYFGILGIVWAVALGAGPVIGGALATLDWRWLFWIHAPPIFAGIVLVILSGHVFARSPIRPPVVRTLARVDWMGNILVTGAAASIILGLTTGGITHPWSGWKVIVPFAFGAAGFAAYLYFEGVVAGDPNLPPPLIKNLTSISGLLATLLSSSMFIIVQWWVPVMQQAVYGHGPLRTGMFLLLLSAGQAPWYMAAGIVVRVFRKFKAPLVLGFSVFTAGVGLLLLLHPSSSLALQLGPLAVISFGSGFVWAICAFPCQVPLAPELQGHALALYSSSRSFGQALGIAAGGSVLQNMLLKRLPEPTIGNGVLSLIPAINTMTEPLASEMQRVFSLSLHRVWLVAVGAGGLGLVVCLFLMRDIALVDECDLWEPPADGGAEAAPEPDIYSLDEEKSPITPDNWEMRPASLQARPRARSSGLAAWTSTRS